MEIVVLNAYNNLGSKSYGPFVGPESIYIQINRFARRLIKTIKFTLFFLYKPRYSI